MRIELRRPQLRAAYEDRFRFEPVADTWPTSPVNNRVASIWFAQRERGFAASVYLVGPYVGMAALTPFLFWIAHRFGWREIFLFTGALGMACALIWYPMYRDPEHGKRVNATELERIRSGGALIDRESATPIAISFIVRATGSFGDQRTRLLRADATIRCYTLKAPLFTALLFSASQQRDLRGHAREHRERAERIENNGPHDLPPSLSAAPNVFQTNALAIN